MTPAQLAALESLALAALNEPARDAAIGDPFSGTPSLKAYIAAANPQAILALIQQLRDQRAAVIEECAQVCDARTLYGVSERIRSLSKPEAP
jgi:hypothetical protein